MGVDKSKLEQLKKDIHSKSKYKDGRQRDYVNEETKEEQIGNRNASGDSNESLEVLDEDNENDNDQANKLYNKMMQNKFGGMGDLIR